MGNNKKTSKITQVSSLDVLYGIFKKNIEKSELLEKPKQVNSENIHNNIETKLTIDGTHHAVWNGSNWNGGDVWCEKEKEPLLNDTFASSPDSRKIISGSEFTDGFRTSGDFSALQLNWIIGTHDDSIQMLSTNIWEQKKFQSAQIDLKNHIEYYSETEDDNITVTLPSNSVLSKYVYGQWRSRVYKIRNNSSIKILSNETNQMLVGFPNGLTGGISKTTGETLGSLTSDSPQPFGAFELTNVGSTTIDGNEVSQLTLMSIGSSICELSGGNKLFIPSRFA